jgi:hypothetical protein
MVARCVRTRELAVENVRLLVDMVSDKLFTPCSSTRLDTSIQVQMLEWMFRKSSTSFKVVENLDERPRAIGGAAGNALAAQSA